MTESEHLQMIERLKEEATGTSGDIEAQKVITMDVVEEYNDFKIPHASDYSEN